MFSTIQNCTSETILHEEKKKKIILFFGVSGVGKTHFSKALSEEIGATYLEKDIVSDALLPKGERYFSPYYDAYVKDQSYEVLYALARSNLAIGKNIIIDELCSVRILLIYLDHEINSELLNC